MRVHGLLTNFIKKNKYENLKIYEHSWPQGHRIQIINILLKELNKSSKKIALILLNEVVLQHRSIVI